MMGSTTGASARRPVLFGALGFGIGLALAGSVLGGFTFQIAEYQTNLLFGGLLFALAGALGGAMLALSQAPRRWTWLLALAAGAGMGLGYLVVEAFFSELVQPYLAANMQGPGDLVATFAYLGQFALIGAVAGVALGAAQRDRLQVFKLLLYGAIGFGAGFFVQDLVGSLINNAVSALVPGQLGDPSHDRIALAVIFGVTFLVAGLIGGAALGLGWNIPSDEPEQPESATG